MNQPPFDLLTVQKRIAAIKDAGGIYEGMSGNVVGLVRYDDGNILGFADCTEARAKQVFDMWTDIQAAATEVERLRSAIKTHRGQKADDRCWEDDVRLYEVLGDGDRGDFHIGDRFAMAQNCMRFLENRCMGGKWKTYAELEAENKQLKSQLYGFSQ